MVATLTTVLLTWAVQSPGTRPSEALKLELRLDRPQLGPIEPLAFTLVLSNPSTADVGGLAKFADYKTTTVEYLAPGSSAWRALQVPRLNLSMLKTPVGEPNVQRLEAKGSKSVQLSALVDLDRRRETGAYAYYFTKPGDYRLRATYRPPGGETIQSNEVRFKVVEYTGVDLQAHEWLRHRPIPHFMYDFDVYADGSAHETDDDAREVLSRFPTSRFAPWARLFLARCYVFGVRRSPTRTDAPDLAKASDLASELARSDLPRIRAAASQVLAEIEMKRKSVNPHR
ncbi:MAG: hypothetical protein HY718_14945 [Planctomycetes bacterium]|nr:hypothetical protein [Planctomycetota bacterium]